MTTTPLSRLALRTEAPPISWLMATALARPRLISLAAGFTDNPSLPVRETRALLNELLGSKTRGPAALQYGTSAGDPRLRELTAARVRSLDGLPRSHRTCRADRALVTHGSQQLLYLLAEALCDPGDIVLIEDPTYFVFLGIVQSRGLRVRGIRTQPDGLDIARLEEALETLRRNGQLRRVKLLYLVSYFQNPSGVTTRFEKKRAALRLLRHYEKAAGHPLYLVEDTAYRELRFDGPDEKSALAAGEGADRVLYAGTYSKPFATGVRVGFGFLPEPVWTAVLRLKGNHDFGTSNLLQQLMARALESGVYARHVGVLRRRYARKAQIMLAAMRECFPETVRYQPPRGGLYFWPALPPRVETGMDSKFFRAALRQEVLYVPGELCYGDDPTRRKPANEMRLSFGAATEANLAEGIARLGAALRQLKL